jgi:hypothetical protein
VRYTQLDDKALGLRVFVQIEFFEVQLRDQQRQLVF